MLYHVETGEILISDFGFDFFHSVRNRPPYLREVTRHNRASRSLSDPSFFIYLQTLTLALARRCYI